MPLVYVWKVKTGEREGEREVRFELGLLGTERLLVDGGVEAASWSPFRFGRRIPVPLGAGHSAGVEYSLRRLWPDVAFSLDGKTIEAARRPRVPLWGWAYTLVAAGVFFLPMARFDMVRYLARALGFVIVSVLCVYTAVGFESAIIGLVSAALLVSALWATVIQLRV